MRTDTPSCRVGWDLVLEEPQESFNPPGPSGSQEGEGEKAPFLAPLSSILDSFYLSCHQGSCVGLGKTPFSALGITWFTSIFGWCPS